MSTAVSRLVLCVALISFAVPAEAARRSTARKSTPTLTTPPLEPAAEAGLEARPAVAVEPEPAPDPAVKPAPVAVEAIEGRPSSVQIQVRLLGDRLAAAFKDRPGNGRYERWAVVPFDNQGEDAQKRQLGQVVASELEGRLKVDHGFVLVERMQMSRVLEEMQLAQVGLVDETKAPEMGKMLDAQVLVTGTVGQLGDKFVVNARVVSVEEAKVLASAQVTIDAAGLIALSSDAVVLRTKSDAVFRSLIIPGWGQFYNRQQAKGAAIMIASGALIAGGVTFYVLGNQTESTYRTISKENPGPCADRAIDQLGGCVEAQRVLAESRYGISRALFVGLGAVYVFNVLDAWISGYSPDSASASLYASEGLQLELAPGWAGVSSSF